MKRGEQVRDIQTNDYYLNQDLFLPPHFRQEVFSFIQNNVVTKDDGIGRKVTGDLFTAESYNEYLQKLLRTVTHRFDVVLKRRDGVPMMQVNQAAIIRIIDQYIRTRLFATPFDPFHGSDWKILLSKGAVVTDHIVKEVSVAIYLMQQRVTTTEAVVEHTRFSSVKKVKMRESFSLPLQKNLLHPRRRSLGHLSSRLHRRHGAEDLPHRDEGQRQGVRPQRAAQAARRLAVDTSH